MSLDSIKELVDKFVERHPQRKQSEVMVQRAIARDEKRRKLLEWKEQKLKERAEWKAKEAERRKEYYNERYKKNREAKLEYNKNYTNNNPDKTQKRKEYYNERYKKNREVRLAKAKENYRLKKLLNSNKK